MMGKINLVAYFAKVDCPLGEEEGKGSVPRYLLLGTFSKETSSRDTWKISSSPYFWPFIFLFRMLYFLKGKFYAEITYTR